MRYAKIIVFFTLFFMFSRNAHAYLDPGAGSYILQVIIAFFLGLLFAIKLFWIKIITFFKSLLSGTKLKK